MTQDTTRAKAEGDAHGRAQKDLTASVGTRLVEQTKDRKKRRLFGGRRKPSTPGS
jgi:hypothetical protein